MTLALYSIHHPRVISLGPAGDRHRGQTWQGGTMALSAPGTHVGFVYEGALTLSRGSGEDSAQRSHSFELTGGMYFCLPGEGRLEGQHGRGLIITCPTYRGMFSLGGPLEPAGRLAYIDGGTSSLLIPPVLVGDPCLNAMYFPAGLVQTTHTHPSDRLGLVIAGAGIVETPDIAHPIALGDIFWISAHQQHRFCTADSSLTIVVFHPDSEGGFTHRDHPMLRRTLVDGISAAELPEIQTPVEPLLSSPGSE
ncbi:acetylornithine aminotransferase [filamentous cyanobacterium CCT1]|nr:acetylornithine aminotransferase [filamentous cyanobacterium CCT1]PSN76087.1 acetylornithine aminotransferase [filamentous cyanobacterium CCP4]